MVTAYNSATFRNDVHVIVYTNEYMNLSMNVRNYGKHQGIKLTTALSLNIVLTTF